MNLSELKPANKLFAMFVGDSGSGKTCAALSLPTPGLLIDIDLRAEGGLTAQEWLPPNKLSEWEVIRFPSEKGFQKIDERLERIDREIKAKTNTLKTIVIDSLTMESRLLINDSLTLESGNVDRQGNPIPLINAHTIGTMRMPGPTHFRYELEGMAQVIDYLKEWPLNVICSAHMVQKYVKPENGNEYSENIAKGEQLALRDKVGVRMLLQFNEVYKFSKDWSAGEVVHKVRFYDADLAKTAYGTKLPKKEINITNQDFHKVWCGYLNSEIKK